VDEVFEVWMCGNNRRSEEVSLVVFGKGAKTIPAEIEEDYGQC
jgi:hypothetical protein